MPRTITRALTLLAIVAVLIIGGVMAAHRLAPSGGTRPGVALAVPREQYKPVVGTYGGRYVRATISPPKSFNPVTSGETSTTEYTAYMYLGLTRTDAWTAEVQPDLALSWTPDESGLVWTVKLRPGVLWSDGVPFTADDVLFTYDTTYDPNVTSSMRDIISGPNGERWKLEKVDDLTVRFTLFDRNAIFPELIGDNIIPKHKFESIVKAGKFDEAMGTTSSPQEMPVTGPFMFASYDGSRVILKRNPNYYRRDSAGNRLPYLDEMVTIIVPDIDVQSLKFLQGETDILPVVGKDYPNLVKPRELSNFTVYRLGATFGESFLVLNQNTGKNPKTGEDYVEKTKLAWFRDVRFRRAMSHLMDRKFMADGILNGLAYPQYGPMSNHLDLPMAKADIARYEYDPNTARALLAEMGLTDRNGDGWLEDPNGGIVEINLTTNVENEPRAKVAATMAQDMKRVGIRVNFRAMSFNTLITKLDYTNDWEACVMSLTGGPEPAWGGNVWKSSGRLHMWFPQQKTPSTEWEAQIDELFATGIAELDTAKRKVIFGRWQEIVALQQPFIYTVTPENLIALRNRFGNVFPAPLGGVTHNIDELYILEGSAQSQAAPAAQARR